MADEDGTTEEPEEWRWIPGYEGLYEASARGEIRSVDRVTRMGRSILGRTLKPGRNPNGYPFVNLCRNGRFTSFTVHRLVLEAFVGPRPAGYEGCHGDGVKGNSALSNLRWGTRADNQSDMNRHGTVPRGERNGNTRLSDGMVLEIRRLRGLVDSRKVAEIFGISKGHAKSIWSGGRWSHLPGVTRSVTQGRGALVALLKCPTCGVPFERLYGNCHLTKGSRATFCSRTCSGRFSGDDPSSGNVLGIRRICGAAKGRNRRRQARAQELR